MPQQDMETDRGAALIQIGRIGICDGDEQALDAYFNQEDYVFHGPDGELDYPGLKAFFTSMRNALEGYSCTRHDLIVKGDMIGARTRMAGRFTAPFEPSPFGRIEPNGQPITLEIVNFFRYDDHGKLVEEWVQYDNLGFYKQLGLDVIPKINSTQPEPDGGNRGLAA